MASQPPKKTLIVQQPVEEPEEDEDEEMEGEEDDEFDDDEFDDEGMDLGAVLEPFLATEDGQTIATALVSIAKHMENQNKILIKMLTHMTKPPDAAAVASA